VSIVVQCPHCETRFNLQAEMNGKTMRCPNLECRMGFVVKAMEATAPPAAFELPPEPPPPAKPAAPPKPAAGKPPKPKPVEKKPEFEVVDAAVVDAVVVEAAVVSPPKVKEVVWSEGTDVPPTKKGGKRVKAEDADAPDPDFIPRRKKKKNRGPIILVTMGVLSAAIVLFAIAYIFYYQGKSEEKLATLAKEQYEKGDYNEATKSYEKLTKEYPSSKRIDEYKFFHDLSTMQTTVRSVTNRENYDAAVKRLREFIATHKDSPLAKPATGYGRDILEAGKKLGEDIAAHADDRVKDFVKDRANKPNELSRADKAIADGRELIPVIDPFRGPDDPAESLDRLRGAFDAAEKAVRHERARTAAINKARDQLTNPTDALIQSALADLETAGFAADPEAVAIIATAKGKLRDLVKYEDDPADPLAAPPNAAASLLFVTPVGKTKLREPAPGEAASTVFLCVARGILYALDEDTGALLWATRVGLDVTDPPALARVPLDTGPTDLAIVTSNVGNAPAVSAHL
jgi:tetratricopeptide (TPR) repeat protein